MNPPLSDHLLHQVAWLFLLAISVACVAWTVTHEEVFSEIREYCKSQSQICRTIVRRKFFYLFTCEYCFSHWVTAGFLALTRFRLLLDDWRGYILAFFAVVFIANMYMSLFARLRVDIRSEKAAADVKEREKLHLEKKLAAERLAHDLAAHELSTDGVPHPR